MAVRNYLKRRSFTLAENPKLSYLNLDFACGNLGVFCGTLSYLADGCENILASRGKGLIKHGLVGVFVKCELNYARSVAQIYKYE